MPQIGQSFKMARCPGCDHSWVWDHHPLNFWYIWAWWCHTSVNFSTMCSDYVGSVLRMDFAPSEVFRIYTQCWPFYTFLCPIFCLIQHAHLQPWVMLQRYQFPVYVCVGGWVRVQVWVRCKTTPNVSHKTLSIQDMCPSIQIKSLLLRPNPLPTLTKPCAMFVTCIEKESQQTHSYIYLLFARTSRNFQRFILWTSDLFQRILLGAVQNICKGSNTQDFNHASLRGHRSRIPYPTLPFRANITPPPPPPPPPPPTHPTT